jgi:hypothetical protein
MSIIIEATNMHQKLTKLKIKPDDVVLVERKNGASDSVVVLAFNSISENTHQYFVLDNQDIIFVPIKNIKVTNNLVGE